MNAISLPPCDHIPQPYIGPSADEVFALRRQFLNPAIFHYYQKPLMIVEGRGQWLFDEKGRRYLDGFGGIATVSVGHAHPQVIAAARNRQEGWVEVEFTVGPDGSVGNPHVTASQPSRVFDREAIAAVQRAKFEPKMQNGVAVASTLRRRIEFKLGN